ncbi:hypothetical protein ACFV8T_37660 [Streptomyces sp. NPDC059832]|uniref:hypothetical protein n=1 Tax=Streptomyces sp. NPDC059832 TaxID=3346966 RepID=UPI00364C107D
MTGRPPARRPASARTLYRVLTDLGAAPKLDPRQRPDGPKRTDTALLLGVLLAKTELDAAQRADPAQEPPRGLTRLLAGYCSATASPADETRLRLLSLRLVRSAIEATLDDDSSPLSRAAGDSALAAAGLIDADRLTRTGASPTAINACLDTAAQSLTAATTDIDNLIPRRHRTRCSPTRTHA